MSDDTEADALTALTVVGDPSSDLPLTRERLPAVPVAARRPRRPDYVVSRVSVVSQRPLTR